MRDGWDRLTPGQRIFFGFWIPSFVAVCVFGAVGCFFLGFGIVAVILAVISIVAATSIILTIRDGARGWPRPRP